MNPILGDGLVSGLEDDGLYTPSIKDHSLEKIRLHNYYDHGAEGLASMPWEATTT